MPIVNAVNSHNGNNVHNLNCVPSPATNEYFAKNPALRLAYTKALALTTAIRNLAIPVR